MTTQDNNEAASASQSSTPVPRVGGNTSIEVRALSNIGSMMANVLFNIGQGSYTEDYISTARNLCEKWDAARSDLAHVARQRQESGKLDFTDYSTPVTYSNGTGATPSAAVAEGVDTAELDGLRTLAEFWAGKFHSSFRSVREGHGKAWAELVEFVTAKCAQQREAGRREIEATIPQLIEDDRKNLVSWTHWKERAEKAEAALARQPVSEGQQPTCWIDPIELRELENGTVAMVVPIEGDAQRIPLYRAVPPAKAEGMSAAAQDVLAERQRQVSAEGWTPAHDDAYQKDELQRAAMCYLMRPACDATLPHALWPWDFKWWKPADDRRNLVKAGALLLAEIERIDRLAQQAKKGEQQP